MLRVLEIDGFDQFWAACDEQLVVHVIEDSILMMKYHSGYDCTACFHRFEDFMSSCPWEKFKLPSGSGVRFLWHLKRCSRDATTVSALQRVAVGFANMLEFFKIDLEASAEPRRRGGLQQRGRKEYNPFAVVFRPQSYGLLSILDPSLATGVLTTYSTIHTN